MSKYQSVPLLSSAVHVDRFAATIAFNESHYYKPFGM